MERLFAAIPSILKGLEPTEDVTEAVVFAAWRQAAGELIGSRTTPLGFGNKRLVVAVEDETWRRNLKELSPQLVAKINESLGHGTVAFIEFSVRQLRS